MKTKITARKITLDDAFKNLIEKKLSKFDRIFDDGTAYAEAVVTSEKNRETVEITIKHNSSVYRAENTSSNRNDSLDKVILALAQQFRKHKTKLSKRLKKNFDIDEGYFVNHQMDENSEVFEERHYQVARSKKLPIKPMSLEEAILEMDMIGHKFFMFKNGDTDDINVVYKRRNGGFGLLEPEIM